MDVRAGLVRDRSAGACGGGLGRCMASSSAATPDAAITLKDAEGRIAASGVAAATHRRRFPNPVRRRQREAMDAGRNLHDERGALKGNSSASTEPRARATLVEHREPYLVSGPDASPAALCDLSRIDIGSPFSRGLGAYAESLRRNDPAGRCLRRSLNPSGSPRYEPGCHSTGSSTRRRWPATSARSTWIATAHENVESNQAPHPKRGNPRR